MALIGLDGVLQFPRIEIVLRLLRPGLVETERDAPP